MRITLPSERKFEVYHAVKTQLMSRRDAAARFGISPTRVQQMVADVERFITEHGSVDLLNLPPDRLELASLNVCHAKLSHFYKQIMQQWRVAEQQPGGVAASVRLLHAAARISLDQTRLVARIAKARQALIESGSLQPTVYEFVHEDEQESTIAPPTGGCTLPPAKTDDAQLQAMMHVLATGDQGTTCDDFFDALLRRRDVPAAGKTPVQVRKAPRRRGKR